MHIRPEVTPLRTLPKVVAAGCFNEVRLALLRLGSPLRVGLRKHTGLEFILERDRWLCVDSPRDDLPVLEWCGFACRGRDALHEPVQCVLRLYHLHAGLIMGSVLDELEALLKVRLASCRGLDRGGRFWVSAPGSMCRRGRPQAFQVLLIGAHEGRRVRCGCQMPEQHVGHFNRRRQMAAEHHRRRQRRDPGRCGAPGTLVQVVQPWRIDCRPGQPAAPLGFRSQTSVQKFNTANRRSSLNYCLCEHFRFGIHIAQAAASFDP